MADYEDPGDHEDPDDHANPFLDLFPLMSRRRPRTSPSESESKIESSQSKDPNRVMHQEQPVPRCSRRPSTGARVDQAVGSDFSGHLGTPSPEETTDTTNTSQLSDMSPSRGHRSRRIYNSRGRRRGMSSSRIMSPPRAVTNLWTEGDENQPPAQTTRPYSHPEPVLDFEPFLSYYKQQEEEVQQQQQDEDEKEEEQEDEDEDEDEEEVAEWPTYSNGNNNLSTRVSNANSAPAGGTPAAYQSEHEEYNRFILDSGVTREAAAHASRIRIAAFQRSGDNFENTDGRVVVSTLSTSGSAIALMLYRSEHPDPRANDVWPNFRNAAKQPIRYYTLKKDMKVPLAARKSKSTSLIESARPTKMLKRQEPDDSELLSDHHPAPPGWPPGQLPTELFEEIANHLNRDDIKSMRLVCREFDRHLSQVLFNTVVVPFNTEIYGMLGQDQEPDFKGKKKVWIEPKGLTWKNANGDEIYNGHGLDVFKGFGKHILRFGMSFEVNEDSLANPPEKSLTECHQSFWGSYNWPYEEYRRFEDVARLESAADETPKMKVAFSELTRVRELALSIDSGLGWLNGPDRSIRARIMPRPPEVFGTLKKLPDRRSQAQRELWEHIKSCHYEARSNIKQATLYKLEANRPLSELQGASAILEKQPEMPFLDSHIIHEAVPHNTTDSQAPASFDDPEVLRRFAVPPSSSSTGVLYSSEVLPTDAAQLTSPIIPANLTKAQKEWLMETEWAQRAFLSSYMLAIIDNPTTFCQVHTLNFSQLSDRYLSMLGRTDFWNALPNLTNVTFLVIPGWRTVHKDEAGFVETPKICPTTGLEPFYKLLKNIISERANIKKLTIGWVTGGEHAEGIYARNKLIFPAPIVTERTVFQQEEPALSDLLPVFPHVEALTLKNCWVTPDSLRHFVNKHDKLSLKTLVLNSVSLSAIIRDGHNYIPQLPFAGNPPVMVATLPQIGGGQAVVPAVQPVDPQQLLANNIHALHHQIQQLQGQPADTQLFALQGQLHNQIQLHGLLLTQTQNQNQPQGQNQAQQQQATQAPAAQPNAAHVNPPLPSDSIPNATTVLKEKPRIGSWLDMLDIISPGLNLSHFDSEFSVSDPDRITSLTSIQLISCGYVRLPYAPYDQSDIESQSRIPRNPLIAKKYSVLSPAMLYAKWALLGEIIQEVALNELVALNAAWDLETGWSDEEAAGAVEFDGLLPGGSGRFSGIIRKEDKLAEASAN
ncbi:hypothetical protein K505DRAFT_358652 [Melanomma pulvis-pyrius CBS 109.77]|uniref:F-box domain-containing protein n=1 Tax=Melanomma pulvis-pyrius CBS 109.77 TaxID=1314802 RepID=A0A6A6XKT4_9PLEO|nr:hypothetical protein K505DRAFT_358652 [Melanomma pulvis-pyrius CBS 109.77]